MRLKGILIIIPFIVFLSACSKLTKDNYEKLEVGMSQDEVKAIIGSSGNCAKSMGTLTCIWGSEEGKHIQVRFIADAAVTFSNNGL
jgi:hypothetical protein